MTSEAYRKALALIGETPESVAKERAAVRGLWTLVLGDDAPGQRE